MSGFILKGDIVYSKDKDSIVTVENGYVICDGKQCKGVFEHIPDEYSGLKVIDYSGCLIMPGMVDLHTHAPQYAFRGMHMDLELMDWLSMHTFVEEAKYADISYAKKAYKVFADAMKNSATTRAIVFGTIHREATECLMELLDKAGICAYVGMVNMDHDAPENLVQKDVAKAVEETKNWIDESQSRYDCVKPILTPRFIPVCSDEMLRGLCDIERDKKIPVQSHLSENPGEVQVVKNKMPDCDYYGAAYAKYELFGEHANTVMAHCVYSSDEEIEHMKRNGVYIAHCPSSNLNLSSGIAPAKKYLKNGLHIGLGSDVAGGHSESIFNEIKTAIQVSKMYWRYIDNNFEALSFEEAFYMGTLGGGSFFGKVGSFENGYEMDAVVIDDSKMRGTDSIKARLERAVYSNADMKYIEAKYVGGKKVI